MRVLGGQVATARTGVTAIDRVLRIALYLAGHAVLDFDEDRAGGVAETADRMMGCERGGHGAFSVPADVGRPAVAYAGGGDGNSVCQVTKPLKVKGNPITPGGIGVNKLSLDSDQPSTILR